MNEQFAEQMQMLSVRFLPFIMAVIFHEYAHGQMAYYFGDKTAEKEGRLTLNPLVHLDPIGTVLFPLLNMLTHSPFFIGWAKPVPINPMNFRHYRKGLFLVALAGPCMNIFLAFISAFFYFSLLRWSSATFFFKDPLIAMAEVSVLMNYGLAFFNLIPLPPLDGAKMVESFLSAPMMQKYNAITQYSFFILMGLMFTGILPLLLSGPIRFFAELTFICAHQTVFAF